MSSRHSSRHFTIGLATAVLASGVGCQALLPGPIARSPEAVSQVAGVTPPMYGQVVFPDRQVAALTSDVANGATLSFIDTTTGQTVATTASNASGSFALSFTNFAANANQPYVVEAVKGLPVGSSANRGGASAARLRTLVSLQAGGWKSLTNGTVGGALTIGQASTVVAALAGLRGLSTANQLALMGSINGTTFTPAGTLAAADFTQVSSLVAAALAADQDPIEVLGYDPSATNPYGIKPGTFVFFDNFLVNGLAGAATASTAAPNNALTFYGQNFPSSGSVMVGGQLVATFSIGASRSVLTATLSPFNTSGPVTFTQGQTMWIGPYLPVSGTVGTVAGQNNGFADGRGFQAMLSGPTDVAADSSGNFYVVDYSNCRIRKVTPAGTVTTFAGSGTVGTLDGTGTAAQFNYPWGIAIDSTGSLYVTEYYGHCIRKISPAGAVTTLAGTPGTSGFVDGAGATAKFNQPYGLSVDVGGNVYVADTGNQRIRKVSPTGVVSTLAGSGTAGNVNGTGTGASFSSPQAVAVDGSGNVYVADTFNSLIRKVTSVGVVTTLAGSGSGYVDGTGIGANFNSPRAIAIDSAGVNLYVSDYNNYRIRRLAISTGLVSTVLGNGTALPLDGPTPTAMAAGLAGLAVSNGNLAFVDRGANRIRMVAF